MLYIFLLCASRAWTRDDSNNMWTSQELYFHLITNSENNLNEIINDVASAQAC